MAELAAEHRPLIPAFKEFKAHIIRSIRAEPKLKELPTLWALISKQTSYQILVTIYGSFRHWGHPYIDYVAGLEKLYNQVQMEKEIDGAYTEALASDLAFLVIRNQFKTKKSWPVDITLMNNTDPMYQYIAGGTWPSLLTIRNYGDKWHLLPLKKCFEIPDVIDPSTLYSDKSHSLTRQELIDHLKKSPDAHIPSHKVLTSLLERPATNWPEFLKRVNDHGISVDQLIIGLKAKERELKIEGRFFSLMSWDIRDYFVMTEYLIKTHYVPLFKGLTMADDFTTVVGKLLENTEGQGEKGYDFITIADHIDYEKWNNHQRAQANNPVFKVMGQFLGYPNLITRTHEIFEKSWIYYAQRGDLIEVQGTQIKNKTSTRVCWNGQLGGLEGLRQKGWSICNLLVLHRESEKMNTKVKVLAQGDNQVICSQYKLRTWRNSTQLVTNIQDLVDNNAKLMESVVTGTRKLGLIINQDETMKSAEMLNYGKNIVIRGNILNLETKRWSRMICVTNDQLPTLANVMSTVTSNALTVAHMADSPFTAIFLYNFFGHLVRIINEVHNPALRCSVPKHLNVSWEKLNSLPYLARSLYLDPSMGGACGMSLTRFIVRMFPDPITESLTFFKLVHDNTCLKELKEIMISFGYPTLGKNRFIDITKLIEDPLSLNIPRGLDATTLIKEEIKSSLNASVNLIKNLVIKQAVKQLPQEPAFIRHLKSISPLFPRFLSEYYSGTYFGIVNNVVGLFQNSKTIRNHFKRNLAVRYDKAIIDSEVYTLNTLIAQIPLDSKSKKMWDCSATQADKLRTLSWKEKVVGATIPHPAEMFGIPVISHKECHLCPQEFPYNLFISVLIPEGFRNLKTERGTCSAYLGSSTLESTSILQSWERETKVPMIKRAASLRGAIGWFINQESNLASAIFQNLQALTGENWAQESRGCLRTGSALHRFNCSRQSNGGYAATNPSKLTRMIATTNKLADLGSKNYDFMFQNCILNSLYSVGEIHNTSEDQGFYHQHIKCAGCLREIEEIKLECAVMYTHKDMSAHLAKWKPDAVSWSIQIPTIEVRAGVWNWSTANEKSFYIGQIQGFIFGDSTWGKRAVADDPQLFPLSIRKHVVPYHYCKGLLYGMLRSSSVSIMHQRRLKKVPYIKQHILGLASLTSSKLIDSSALLNIWRQPGFTRLFTSIPHRIPAHYPMLSTEIGTLGLNYLRYLLLKEGPEFFRKPHTHWESQMWIFSDVHKLEWAVLLGLSEVIRTTLTLDFMSKAKTEMLDKIRDLSVQVRESVQAALIPPGVWKLYADKSYSTPCEVRHAVKEMPEYTISNEPRDGLWEIEYTGHCRSVKIDYTNDQTKSRTFDLSEYRFQNPTISGLRPIQIATGSHYKMREILHYLDLQPPHSVLCGGDGSGEISALVMRKYPSSKLLFNTLCEYKDVQLRGNEEIRTPPMVLRPHVPLWAK